MSRLDAARIAAIAAKAESAAATEGDWSDYLSAGFDDEVCELFAACDPQTVLALCALATASLEAEAALVGVQWGPLPVTEISECPWCMGVREHARACGVRKALARIRTARGAP